MGLEASTRLHSRAIPSIVAEISRQGRYLDGRLRVEKLNRLARIEFRQMVKVVDRLAA